ncbi:MAG: transcription antitermination factor NusB, partial [Vicinamibacterales bacterium]
MVSPAREAALRALGALSADRVDLGEALSRARDPLADVRDRALVTELVIGTLRWRGAIDHQIQRLSAKPLARLDSDVLDAIRLGAYQILYLARVPVSAVVNDTVGMVKASRFRSASGFVNAVLRRLSRERSRLSWPMRPANPDSDDGRRALVTHLSVVHSHPAWLVARWIDRYGATETERWLRFNNQPPAMTLAPNRLRSSRDDLAARLLAEGIQTEPTRLAPHGLTVSTGQALSSDAFRDGLCVIQDEASQ